MQKSRQGSRKVRIALSLVYVTAFVYIIVVLTTGGHPGILRLPARVQTARADEFHFNIGRNRVFADLGGSFVAAGTVGLQILSEDGNQIMREYFRMQNPAISAMNSRAIVYDIGGYAIRAVSPAGVTAALYADGSIVSATMNRNGWFTVVTQEGVGYRGNVTIYDDRGSARYRLYSADGFSYIATLSPNNRNLADLRFTDEGSQIRFLRMPNYEPQWTKELSGEIVIDLSFMPNGNLLALTTRELILIDGRGNGREIFTFSGRRLGAYSKSDDFISLYLLDYGVGYSGRLVNIRANGDVLGELTVDREILSMSLADGYLAVLWSDGLMFYSAEFNEFPPYPVISIAGANRVHALPGGTALAYGDFSAVVLQR